jgi:hypothetical protein
MTLETAVYLYEILDSIFPVLVTSSAICLGAVVVCLGMYSDGYKKYKNGVLIFLPLLIILGGISILLPNRDMAYMLMESKYIKNEPKTVTEIYVDKKFKELSGKKEMF